MDADVLSVGELADAAGLSRRSVRFYVQQRLLPPPLGRGRGRHYDRSHLERLRRVMELQAAGHSLDAIRRILEGGAQLPPVAAPPAKAARPRRAMMSAELWTRLRVAPGVELHFDAAAHSPTAEQLLALRSAIASVFRPDLADAGPNGDAAEEDETPDDARE